MTLKLFLQGATASLAVLLCAGQVSAADLAAKPAPAPVPESCKVAITFPAYGGVIKQNPNPSCFTIAGIGEIYVGGAVTGYAYTQTNPFPAAFAPPGVPPDRSARVDFSNIQGFIQKADGPFQFYMQVGGYSIPSLGLPIYSAFDQTDLLFGAVPVVFGKYVINEEFSIQGGRMPTLIGSEAIFTFQNLNISRGLVFNQENFINHGVQINYASGPWSVSLAGTDGFFSGELNWITGAITYKIDDANTVGVNGGTSVSRFNSFNRSLRFQYATPAALQNSSIVSLNYTYAAGPWIVTPYVQFTNVDPDAVLGFIGGAQTYGGALLASYAFTDNFALAGRFEYIAQSGNRFNPTSNVSLLYGQGSEAVSFTVTPTFTFGQYFVRGEYSRVEAYNITRGNVAFGTLGTGFGRTGNRTSQDRYMVETGITF
ncbi:porin [uncultured Methylobacterium sp.]|uniref:porin n=1 Tax=uncultured Methylobacterium sp. TaxID=157278 RepID=UPI0035C99ED8